MDEAVLDKKDFQFLFASGDMLTFMDMESYEQIELQHRFRRRDQAQFLQDGMKTLVQMYEDRPIGIKLPVQVTLTVAEADPVMKGGTAAPQLQDRGAGEWHEDPGAALHRRRRDASSSPPKTAPMSAGARIDGLRLPRPECDDRRRAQGGPPADPRLRRTGKSADLDEGPGRFRHQRRQAHRDRS